MLAMMRPVQSGQPHHSTRPSSKESDDAPGAQSPTFEEGYMLPWPDSLQEQVSSPDKEPYFNDHEDYQRGDSVCSRGSTGGSDVATQQAAGVSQRPAVAAGRPFTRRMREAQARAQQGNRSRRVVYVDHHHVHHHHHFHGASSWGGPGDIPAEPERQPLELSAEADAEHARVVRATTPRKANGAELATSKSSGDSRSAGVAMGPGTADPPKPQGLDTELVHTAQALFSRDSTWPSSASANVRACTAAETKAKQLLPLSEYLALVSQLTPETRLKFSPYGVPRSARATAGAFGGTPGAISSSRRIQSTRQ